MTRSLPHSLSDKSFRNVNPLMKPKFYSIVGNCNSAIKDIESNSAIHFQVIPTSGATSSVNSTAGTVNNLSNNTRLLSSNNSILTLTATPSLSATQTSTSTTASTTALGKSSTSVELNFNQTADNQIGVTTNNNSNSVHIQNRAMENGGANTLHHSSIVNHVRTATTAANHLVNAPIVTSTPPLVLSLSQV